MALSLNLDGFENPLAIHSGKISIPFISSQLVPCKLGSYKVPIECHVNVSGQKRIVKTVVPGRDGSVKELTGRDDYSVKIDLILLAKNYSKVSKEVESIIALWEKKDSINIVCPKTEMYGIEKVVFESFDHPETPGMPGYEKLSLTFSSDEDLVISTDTSLLGAVGGLV